jgi:hypothetical protein
LKAHAVREPLARGSGIFYIEVNVINFHGLIELRAACLSILTFYQNFQVIPNKYRAIAENQKNKWLSG